MVFKRGDGMAQPTKHKAGAGMTLTLQIMSALELLPCVILLAAGLSLGWPTFQTLPNAEKDAAPLVMLYMLMILMRFGTLIVMARWTWRLTSNAGRQTHLPVTPRWAWLGWFVPLASLVVPFLAVLALNRVDGRVPGPRKFLIVAWWLARLTTCVAGAMIVVVIGSIVLILTHMKHMPEDATIMIRFLMWLSLYTVVAKVLEFAIVTLTYRHQPKAGEVLAATVF